MKKVEIKYKIVKIPEEIIIDGKLYPNCQRNFEMIQKYEETKDESFLDKLTEVTLVF